MHLLDCQRLIAAMDAPYAEYLRLSETGRIGDAIEAARDAYNAAFTRAAVACIAFVRAQPVEFLTAEHGQGALPEIDNSGDAA
jgi:hypothetical protein